jgi:hypothetical protein
MHFTKFYAFPKKVAGGLNGGKNKPPATEGAMRAAA